MTPTACEEGVDARALTAGRLALAFADVLVIVFRRGELQD
jgi:hypothetical protein